MKPRAQKITVIIVFFLVLLFGVGQFFARAPIQNVNPQAAGAPIVPQATQVVHYTPPGSGEFDAESSRVPAGQARSPRRSARMRGVARSATVSRTRVSKSREAQAPCSAASSRKIQLLRRLLSCRLRSRFRRRVRIRYRLRGPTGRGSCNFRTGRSVRHSREHCLPPPMAKWRSTGAHRGTKGMTG